MAMKKSTSRSRAKDTKLETDTTAQSEPRLKWTQMPEALRDAIEAERARLMDAESVLHCAVMALDAGDQRSSAEPYYQSVINLARDLIVTSITQLDMVALNKALSAGGADDAMPGRDERPFVGARRHSVREKALAYLN